MFCKNYPYFVIYLLLMILPGCGLELDNAIDGASKRVIKTNTSQIVGGKAHFEGLDGAVLYDVNYCGVNASSFKDLNGDSPIGVDGSFAISGVNLNGCNGIVVASIATPTICNGENGPFYFYSYRDPSKPFVGTGAIVTTYYDNWNNMPSKTVGVSGNVDPGYEPININLLTHIAYKISKNNNTDYSAGIDVLYNDVNLNTSPPPATPISKDDFMKKPLTADQLKYVFNKYNSQICR